MRILSTCRNLNIQSGRWQNCRAHTWNKPNIIMNWFGFGVNEPLIYTQFLVIVPIHILIKYVFTSKRFHLICTMNYTWNRMWSSLAPLVCLASSPANGATDWPLSWKEKRPRCWEAGLRFGREVPGQAPGILRGDHASQPNAFKASNSSPNQSFCSHSHIRTPILCMRYKFSEQIFPSWASSFPEKITNVMYIYF